MMVTRNDILKVLPVFMGYYELISEDQTIEDIMKGIKKCHKEYAAEYDSICEFFIGATPYKTCENIFDFLRDNSFYFVEDELNQTVRSPQAIVAMGAIEGIDCKNYALFAGGILDAINRTGLQYIPFVYRFVSDRLLDTTPNHVFIVAFPGTKREIWIDPIPQVKQFNQHINYYYHTDKNYKAMALFKISGLNQAIEDLDFVVVERPRIGYAGEEVVTAVADFIPAGSLVSNVFSSILNSRNAPNPNDWMGWTPGDVKDWVRRNGDSVQNEALNIIQYIQAHGTKDITDSDAFGVPRVSWDQIITKLTNGGYGQQAQLLKQQQGGGVSLFSNSSGNSMFTTKNLLIGGVLVFAAGKWVFKWW